MEPLRLNKVKRVVALRTGPSGEMTSTVIYKKPGKKRKTSAALRPMEKAERRFANAQRVYWEEYGKRHNRSNAKGRDGWARDFAINVARASREGGKEL